MAACVVGTVAALASAPTASAAPLPSECVHPIGSNLVTCTFDTAGEHELTLPDGITSITVTAVGGSGGDADAYNQLTGGTFHSDGGVGAVVTSAIAVTEPTVYAFVGGDGSQSNVVLERSPGGFNGGGQGGWFRSDESGFDGTGSGGGASDVRTAGRDLQSRRVIAAGGGGAGGAVPAPGGDAGSAGPNLRNLTGGQAGTATSGGAGGDDGAAGALGQGGASYNLGFGGGGGGGLYGGGGSGYVGGGGGSSLDPDGPGPTLAARGTAPSVTITFTSTAPPTPPCSGSACLTPGMFGSS